MFNCYKDGFITENGFYEDIPNEIYHSQEITELPSISSTMAKSIVFDSAEKVRYNMTKKKKPTKAMEFGSAAHIATLEEEKFDTEIVFVDAKDWRTKSAKEERDQARSEGKIPLLVSEKDSLVEMRNALRSHDIASEALKKPIRELSGFKNHGNIWVKIRIDLAPESLNYLCDFKTSVSANPKDFERQAAKLGYHVSAAYYMDIASRLTGNKIKDFWFIVQEKEAPFSVSVFKFDDEAIDVGRKIYQKGIKRFAWCIENNKWPGYQQKPGIMSLPQWEIEKWT